MLSQQSYFPMLNDENMTPRFGRSAMSHSPIPMPREIASPTPTPSSPRPKPRVDGIGRAPSRRKTGLGSSASADGDSSGSGSGSGSGSASSHHQHAGVRGVKPYARSTSSAVDRAKQNANKTRFGNVGWIEYPATGPPSSAASHTAAAAPSAVPTTAAAAVAPAPAAPAPAPVKTEIRSIPLRLPRPVFPPVYCRMPGLVGVPPQYILDAMRTFLPQICITSTMFQPLPEINIPEMRARAWSPSAEMPGPSSLVFGVQDFLLGRREWLRARIRGVEPNMCLAISQRGGDGKTHLMVPINQVVYASQCAYWPVFDTTGVATGVRFVPASASAAATAAAAAAGSRQATAPAPETPSSRSNLDTIDEESDTDVVSRALDDDVSELNLDEDAVSEAAAPAATPAAGPEPEPEAAQPTRRPGDPISLPILYLDLPSVDTVLILHSYLHFPQRSLIPQLLKLKRPSDPASLQSGAIHEELRQLSINELRERLTLVHGLWKNMSALGFAGTDRTWTEMAEAWGHLVSILALKQATSPPSPPPAALNNNMDTSA